MPTSVTRKRGAARKPSRSERLGQPALQRRVRKVSLTVDEGVLRALQKEAQRSGRTLSAEVSEALGRELRRRRLQQLIEEFEAEHGPITADELAQLDSE